MDFDPLEQKKGITISAAATSTTWTPAEGPFAGESHRITVLDTPGHVDFTLEVERSLRVLDGAIAVFDASNGVEPQTETVWRQADAHGVPRIAFVNKMDKVGASFDVCLASMRERLGANALPLQIPLGEGALHRGVVDVVRRKAYVFENPRGSTFETRPVPSTLTDAVERARAAIVVACADIDDALFACVCEGDAAQLAQITDDTLTRALRKGTMAGAFVPVLCGSAFKNKGVQMLLDAIVDYLPSPADRPAVVGSDPNADDDARTLERAPSDDAPFCGFAFKVVVDRNAGPVTWVRVYSGVVRTGDVVRVPRKNRTDRIGRIFMLHAAEREERKEARAGDIVGVLGLRDVRTGDTLADPRAPIALETLRVPEPVLSLALTPEGAADREKLGVALARLALEDPSFRVGSDEESGETILRGMGELHLEVVVEKLRDLGVSVRTGRPKVTYRETLAGTATYDCKHVHQNGGVGQYARVVLEVSPLARGAGFVFEDATRGGVIAKELVPAIQKGVAHAMARGVLAGFPVIDVCARVLDGATHVSDSSPLAFEIAGSLAFQEAAKRAGLLLLEPVMRVEVVTPAAALGAVLGDLAQRRGVVRGTRVSHAGQVVDARVPLRALFGYAGALRSISQGRASATVVFDTYAPAPAVDTKLFGKALA